MLAKLRRHYPQCGIVSELIDIDRNLYLVKVSIEVEGKVIATGLAGTNSIETAEDRARERAIAILDLDSLTPAKTIPTAAIPHKAQKPQPLPTPPANPSLPNTAESNGEVSSVPAIANSNVIDLNASRSEEKSTPAPVVAPAENFVAREEINSSDRQEVPAPEGEINTPNILESPLVAEASTENSEPETVLETSVGVATNSEVVEIDFNEIKHKTDIEIKRLGWTKEDGRNFLRTHYGKRTRLHLTDEQLLEFLQYLESQPTPSDA